MYVILGHFCGASLIAKDMLVSAAHCAGGRYDAIIGRHKHNDKDGDVVRVANEYKHPNYNDGTSSNDFMVLKLSRATTANATPVKINSSGSTPRDDENLVVMGWGVTNENSGTTSNKLMEVTVQAVSNSECRSAYGSELNTSTMLCAAGTRKDSCQGDSGGPLIKKGFGNAANDLLVGIVSWGYGCADPDYPGVYARVSAGYSFIQQVVCQESEDSEAREAYNCGSVSSTSLIDPSGAGSESSTSGSGSWGGWTYDEDDDFYYDDDWSSNGSFQGTGGFGGGGGQGGRPPQQGQGSGGFGGGGGQGGRPPQQGQGSGGSGFGGGSGNRPPQGPGSGGSSFEGSSFGSFTGGDDGWFDDDGNYDDWGYDDDDWQQGSSTTFGNGGRPGQGGGGGNWWSSGWNSMSSWWDKFWH